jgi:hypothetical protein
MGITSPTLSSSVVSSPLTPMDISTGIAPVSPVRSPVLVQTPSLVRSPTGALVTDVANIPPMGSVPTARVVPEGIISGQVTPSGQIIESAIVSPSRPVAAPRIPTPSRALVTTRSVSPTRSRRAATGLLAVQQAVPVVPAPVLPSTPLAAPQVMVEALPRVSPIRPLSQSMSPISTSGAGTFRLRGVSQLPEVYRAEVEAKGNKVAADLRALADQFDNGTIDIESAVYALGRIRAEINTYFQAEDLGVVYSELASARTDEEIYAEIVKLNMSKEDLMLVALAAIRAGNRNALVREMINRMELNPIDTIGRTQTSLMYEAQLSNNPQIFGWLTNQGYILQGDALAERSIRTEGKDSSIIEKLSP